MIHPTSPGGTLWRPSWFLPPPMHRSSWESWQDWQGVARRLSADGGWRVSPPRRPRKARNAAGADPVRPSSPAGSPWAPPDSEADFDHSPGWPSCLCAQGAGQGRGSRCTHLALVRSVCAASPTCASTPRSGCRAWDPVLRPQAPSDALGIRLTFRPRRGSRSWRWARSRARLCRRPRCRKLRFRRWRTPLAVVGAGAPPTPLSAEAGNESQHATLSAEPELRMRRRPCCRGGALPQRQGQTVCTAAWEARELAPTWLGSGPVAPAALGGSAYLWRASR